MPHRLNARCLAAALLALAAPGAASAAAFTVDFEEVAIPDGSVFTSVNSDRIPVPGGPDITLSPFPGPPSHLVYDLAQVDSSAGVDTQAMLVSSVAGGPVTFSFGAAVSGLSMVIGDFGSDTDTVLVEFLDDSGDVAAMQSLVFPREINPLFQTFTGAGTFRGFRVSSDTGNTVFIDDIAFDAATATVPLPAGAGLLAGALGLLGALRRRR